MPYDPATRVLSLSYIRDPREHADVMTDTARRMITTTDSGMAWGRFMGFAIGFGALVGIVMEIHRRFVLPLLLGPADIAPFGIVLLQFLPLILVVIAVYVALHFRTARRQRNALMSRLQPGLIVDVDIFTLGMTAATSHFSIAIDWPAVRNIFLDGNRIEIECESFSSYIPERAFTDRAAFMEGAKEIRNLWREAQKRERNSKMIAAGLD